METPIPTRTRVQTVTKSMELARLYRPGLISVGKNAPRLVGAKFLMLNDSGALFANSTTIPSKVLIQEGSMAYIQTANTLPNFAFPPNMKLMVPRRTREMTV